MDNLCHTLTGAALAASGLDRRTRFGGAALMIAANLPDVDVLAFAADVPAVALRRGWTHGVLAQILLPVALTGAFLLIDRWRRRKPPEPAPVRPLPMLLLCYTGVLSHVAMDWLNTYGVRLLMPFSGRWFYGDAVFIVDPWLWLALAWGVLWARRVRRPWPARAAVVAACLYIVLMVVSARSARQHVIAAWTAAHGRPPAALMVGPVPMNPFRKTVIVDAGDRYEQGTFRHLPARFALELPPVPKNDRHPAAQRAVQQDRDFRAVLLWSRFPFYELDDVPGGRRVTLRDVRFAARGIFSVDTVVDHSNENR